MNGKSYNKEGESATACSPTSPFKNKVNDARKKVDPSVGSNADIVTTAVQLKNALSQSTGQIKQVITEWESIENIDGQDKTHASNKTATDAITEITTYTSGDAYDTIGNYTIAANVAPVNYRNWNIYSHTQRSWLYSLGIGN